MEQTRILIVDDNAGFVELTSLIFSHAGATVLTALNATDGLSLVHKRQPDLVLLDVRLPDMDGCHACAQIRQRSNVPIILLTALGEDDDITRGLNAGADDYVVKPVSAQVLLARARALLRRTSPGALDPLRIRFEDGRLTVDLEHHAISVCGESVHVTPTEFRVLGCLLQHADRFLSYRQILERAWGPEFTDSPEYVHVYLHRLRQKLEVDPSNPRYLVTEPGKGYCFSTSPTAP
jgi:two-component system KDP operon response regulator KdpE